MTHDTIEVNQDGYLLQRADGTKNLLLHHELQAVDILNEDEVYFLLLAANTSLVIPQATVGSDLLLVALQKLPGFNSAVVVEAMLEKGRYSCWNRPSP